MQMQEQARPLQAVAGRHPERPEGMADLVAVVLGERRPAGVEVLDDAPVVRARHVAYQPSAMRRARSAQRASPVASRAARNASTACMLALAPR